MMTVLGCVRDNHELWLVLFAAIVCGAGSWSTISLFDRAAATSGKRRMGWTVLTAVAAGAAIWCTHFIAMLGFDPGVPVSFDPSTTVASLFVAILGAASGVAIATRRTMRHAPLLGGAITGLAIVVMHYTGMAAYRVQGIVSWDTSYLVASIVLSVAFSAIALQVAMDRSLRAHRPIAAAMLILAIVSLHFTGMTAFRVEPMLIEGSYSNPQALRSLAFAVAAVALIIFGPGFAIQLIDDHTRAEAVEALRNMSSGLLMLARDGTVRLFNARVSELFGLEKDALRTGMPVREYLGRLGSAVGGDEARLQRIIDNHDLGEAGPARAKVEHHLNDGRIVSMSRHRMPDGGVIVTYDDVTEAREGQRKIAHMAFHDVLTGLPNRRSFAETVDRMAQRSPFVMLMIDLDRFKAVNDTLGHAAGDQLLIEVAQRMRDICAPTDLVFRLGGDEFAVLAERSLAGGHALASDIVAALTRPFAIGDHTVSVGGSAGVAERLPGDDPERLQRMTDLALYKAKERGRGRVETYREGMIEDAERRRMFDADLARAIAARQFELRYQPLYGLPGRELTGFEALLRWHHPERGLVPPAEFIPAAERSGAIVDIGAWVIDEACRQVAQWPQHLYVSINVSPVQLRGADILRHLAQVLDKYRLLPRRVEIEIAETAMLDNSEPMAAALAGLRALGVRIAMDDFGTGYSSLAHLRQFELDRIKIDRSFINASRTDPGSAAVVRAVISMARDLHIATTGEGVESQHQLDALAKLGCGSVQGFLLGEPLGADAARALAAGHGQDDERRTRPHHVGGDEAVSAAGS